MCGICGFIDKKNMLGDYKSILNNMNNKMFHRGPDDAGEYFYKNTALAMRRLSIIDLSTGHQPIHDETQEIWTVLNGEIYNFKELREILIVKGHKFYTNTDTEVVVHLYQEYGDSFAKHLDGMFAVAVYDQQKDKLVIARDRAGKKPFYYFDSSEHFVFGSEMKVLLEHPAVTTGIDQTALQQYLLYSYVLTPRSIFENVKKIPEGHYLVIEKGIIGSPVQYWKYTFPEKIESRPEKDWIEKVDEILYRAVKKRLISDVPLGVFLSGGVDSSLIVAMMCRAMPSKNVKTFSIKVDEPAYDESKWSRQAAEIMNTDHHEFTVATDQILDIMDDVINNMDEPMADSSILPTHIVSKLTRQHVTVALGGDGGDEVFGGYPKYFAQRWAARLEKIPAPIRKWCMEKPLSWLPSPEGSVLLGQGKVEAFFKSLHHNFALRNQFWVSPFLPEQIEDLTGMPLLPEATSPIIERAAEYSGIDDIVNKTMFLDYKIVMQDNFNVKVDRASMLTSLEVREPFMDTELVELAAQIPSRLKVRGMETKYLLKKVTEKYYPKKFIYRKKWGFGIPMKKWICGKLAPQFEEVLSTDNIKSAGLVNPEICRKLLDEHLSGKADNKAPLWNLFLLHKWYGNYVR